MFAPKTTYLAILTPVEPYQPAIAWEYQDTTESSTAEQ